jgi:hypothetical protein
MAVCISLASLTMAGRRAREKCPAPGPHSWDAAWPDRDEALLGQLRQRHLAARQQRMAQREHRHQRLFHDGLADDVGVADGQASEADIDASGLECLDLFHGHDLGKADFDFRHVGPETLDHFRQQTIQRRRHETDVEPVLLSTGDDARAFLDLFQPGQYLQGLFIEKLAGHGQGNGTRGAVDQLGPEQVFSWRICRLRGGWAMCSNSAARLKLSVLATALKYLR